jgi:hypothetical protein
MSQKFIVLAAALGMIVPMVHSQTASSSTPGANSFKVEGRNTETAADTPNDRSLNRSRNAAKMLNETVLARQSIEEHSREGAKRHVDRALTEANELESSAQVSGDGGLVRLYGYMAPDSILRNLLPATQTNPTYVWPGTGTDASAGGRNVLSPSAATPAANAGQTPDAGSSRNTNPSPTPGNQGAAAAATTIPTQPSETAAQVANGDIPVLQVNATISKLRLQGAKAALHFGDLSEADQDLRDVETAVRLEVASSAGLLRTRDELSVARGYVLRGEYHKAQEPLAAAADTLARYASSAPEPYKARLKGMQDEIALSAREAPRQHMGTLIRIDYWCDQLDQWFTQTAGAPGM